MDQKKEEKKSILNRLSCGIKEYYGPLPVLTGLLAAGAVNIAAFTLGAVYNGGEGIVSFVTNGNGDLLSAVYNTPSNVAKLYMESRALAIDWSVPGFAAGQFLGYKLRSTVKSWFKKK